MFDNTRFVQSTTVQRTSRNRIYSKEVWQARPASRSTRPDVTQLHFNLLRLAFEHTPTQDRSGHYFLDHQLQVWSKRAYWQHSPESAS